MTRLDIQIALVFVLLLPVYSAAMKFIGLKIRPIATDWIHAWSMMISFVEKNLSLLPAIKSFSREKLEEVKVIREYVYQAENVNGSCWPGHF